MKVICGDANPKGNVALNYKGGCEEELEITDAYRCVGCGGWFHKECLIRHFELEKEHDWGRNEEREVWKEKCQQARMETLGAKYIYCEICGVQPLLTDDLGGAIDLICKKCHLVIATLHKLKKGTK